MLGAALALPVAARAQSLHIDFETDGEPEATGYTRLGVYDSWENSPFRAAPATGNAELEGHVQVIANHLKAVDEEIGELNSSERILAFQRSRHASNVFGARIDLATPVELTTTTQYVHVRLYTPKEGRVMLVGLGKRRERADQSKEVEQFNVLSTSDIKPYRWCDAVFPIKGVDYIDVYSLVVVPHCEPTHGLDTDFAAFIDDIEINSDPQPRIQYDSYPVSFSKTDKLDRDDRYTGSVKLTSSDGEQSISVAQQSNKLAYQDALASQLKAKAGETVTPYIGYNATWMHSYVYIDRGNDGRFNYDLNADGTPAEGSDVMSYAYYQGKNSKGQSADQQTVQAPTFQVPADLQPGFYRMRYKIDWDFIDPAGANETNRLIDNGGVIVDTRLNVHTSEVSLTRGQNAEGTNGEVLNGDGTTLSDRIPFGQAFTIRVKPANGFEFQKIVLRHGYNLDGDSLVHDTPQYQDVVISASKFEDNTYTIPAQHIDGDVRITPYFPQEGTTDPVDNYYPRNFDDDLEVTRTDRKLNSFTLTGTQTTSEQTISVPQSGKNYVYRNLTEESEVIFVPGETVSTAIDYTGNAMHSYLYVDFNEDGAFGINLNDDGTPAAGGELVAYNYYSGHNSEGESLQPSEVTISKIPSFTLPSDLPGGVYRARLKVDWNNADPAGQYSEGGNNKINDNGGQIVDFLLNVGPATGQLDIQTTNGSVVGVNNSGLAATTPVGQSLRLTAIAAADGYDLAPVTIRHGRNLDGKQYICGNRQWEEYTEEAANFTIPAERVNGDVRICADFSSSGTETYKLRFYDEFDQTNGVPDATFWTRCTRETPAWKRFTAQTEEGQKLTGFLQDGHLVLRCLKNTVEEENAEMISGALESKDKIHFTYGKVEGRMKTTAHTGNFPAFWMMPQDNSAGWPKGGEIDIYEAINEETTSYHTIHSHWGNTLGYANNPKKSGTGVAEQGLWHTFGFEWTPEQLTWYVNGKQVFSYARLNTTEAQENFQWPFDKDFYLILNQSVGNGSWASNPDMDFTYETRFDWVRVYQTDEQSGTFVGISNETADGGGLDYYVSPGKIRIVASRTAVAHIADLQGRTLYKQSVQGNVTLALPQGVYVLNGHKILVP